MKYLGLDLGTKTLGIAISDKSGKLAFTFETIRYKELEELLQYIEKIIQENQIDKIVLGLPKNMKVHKEQLRFKSNWKIDL